MSVLTYSTYPVMFLFSHRLWTFHCNHKQNGNSSQGINLWFHTSVEPHWRKGGGQYVRQDGESDDESAMKQEETRKHFPE